MPIAPEPRLEHPSTYFVADRSNTDELRRLQVQDELMTASMGGVLPEQPNPTAFRRVLDVGCGTGGWLIALAHALPASELLIGVDVSRTFVEYARAQAVAAGVSNRVEFQCMDALRMLEFPSGWFDLVNHRFGMSWLRTWEWNKLLDEYQRVVCWNGVIRCVEAELAAANTPAFTMIRALTHKAFYQAGHLLSQEGGCLAPHLLPLLRRYGLLDVQTHCCHLEYRASTEDGERFCETLRLGLRTVEPFLRKWVRVPDGYSELREQATCELRDPGFVATVPLLTVWGRSGD